MLSEHLSDLVFRFIMEFYVPYEISSRVNHSFLKFNIRVYRGGGFTLKSTARQQTYKRKKNRHTKDFVFPDMPIKK